jgi:hypothetical protein
MNKTNHDTARPGLPPRGNVTVLRFSVAFLLVVAAQTIFGPVIAAQEFRIYTRVSQEMGAAAGPKGNAKQESVVARSLTLFHAGKVYDYIHAVGEVTIFEPGRKRFIILSTTRSMRTQVELDELLGMLNIAQKEMKSYVAVPIAKGGPTVKAAKALNFQLAPDFDARFQTKDNSLTLSSPFVQYEAQCAKAKAPQALTSYLHYADWTCRLNYVLHPNALYPASRLELNNALRKHDVIPTEVRLSIPGENPIRFKAEHEIHWQLDAKDRSYIHRWETMLKDRSTRQISFREYQRAMLVSLSKRTR